MNSYPQPPIAREGWPHLAIAFAAAALVTWAWGWRWAWPLWALAVFVLQFFRDPQRIIPAWADVVLAPADGRIIAVEKTTDPYLNREAHKISVFMNVFNVHSNRSPVDGTVSKVLYYPGKYFNASLSKASLENERNALWIRTPSGQDITCVQVAGLIARRVLCYVREGDKLCRGQRYGFIRFGSRVDIYLPLTTQICAVLGDKAVAGETVLAQLP
jgi:phosphatidylserine decarboxylase